MAAAIRSTEVLSAWDDLLAAADWLDHLLSEIPGPQRLTIISGAVASYIHPEHPRHG